MWLRTNSRVASENELIFLSLSLSFFFCVKPEAAHVIKDKSYLYILTSGVALDITCYQEFLVTNCALAQDYPLLKCDSI